MGVRNVQSWYDENIHTPLFIWDPRSRVAGERRDELVQTIDLGPSLLDLVDVAPTDRMMGRSLAATTQPTSRFTARRSLALTAVT